MVWQALRIPEVGAYGYWDGPGCKNQDMMTRNKIPIDTVVMDVDAMSRWSANTWVTKGGQFGLAPIYLPNGGVVELPGFPGITAIVEPALSDSMAPRISSYMRL